MTSPVLHTAVEKTPTQLNWLELGLGLAIALAAALIGGYVSYRLFHRYSRKIRIRLPRKKRGALARDFGHLYTELIAEGDRLAPSGITRWIGRRGHCPRTRVGIRIAAHRGRHPLHFLLVASCAGSVVGFLKAIYLPKSNLLFVAYLGADKTPDVPSRQVTIKLLRRLGRIVRALGARCRWLAYEITGGNEDPRLRVFSDYAETHGFRSYQLPIEYRQPDMGPSTDGVPAGVPAALAVVPVWAGSKRIDAIDAAEVGSIVGTIYRDVYAEEIDGTLYPPSDYIAYIAALGNQVTADLPASVPLHAAPPTPVVGDSK